MTGGVRCFLDKVVGVYIARQQNSVSESKESLLQLAVLKDVARRLLAAVGRWKGEHGRGDGG